MTCVVGIRDGDTAIVAFDSYVGTGHVATRTATPTKGALLFPDVAVGFAGSVFFAQMVQANLHIPEPVGDERDWVIRELVPGVRRMLNAYQAEKGKGRMVVAVRGRVFEIAEDFGVIESDTGLAAVGSGGGYARAALYALSESGLPAESRARMALAAAAELDTFVREPFHVLRTGVAA